MTTLRDSAQKPGKPARDKKDIAAPFLRDHDGVPVQWANWLVAPLITHISNECDRCSFPGPLLFSTGLISTFITEETESTSVDAFSRSRNVIRFYALACPQCAAQQVYDMGADGCSFVEVRRYVQPQLF